MRFRVKRGGPAAGFTFDRTAKPVQRPEPEKPVYRVALCTGKGMGFFQDAVRELADVYLTGDVTYHEAQDALSTGVSVIDAGHYATEQPIAEAMAQYLQQEDDSLQVYPFTQSEDVFQTL